MIRYHSVIVAAGLSLLVAMGSHEVQAGAYVFAGSGVEDRVTHSRNYNGSGGVVVNNVCIVPGSTNAALLEIPVQNTIARFNQFVAITDNIRTGASNDIPSNAVDIESALIHEVGHCIGLAHPNAASESGLPQADREYTKATTGVNGSFDLGIGADNVRGSPDDIRGDDINLHWFLTSSNNPFEIPDDSPETGNFSVDIADLPGADTFAANADRTVSTLFGVPNTEAAMQQGQFFDEDQRGLVGDDVNTLRFARTGADHVAGTGDDYTLNLTYGGISNSSCDITVALDTSTGFAVCRLTGNTGGLGSNNFVITGADVRYNENTTWYFATKLIPTPVADSLTVDVGGTVTMTDLGSNSLISNDTHPDGLSLNMGTLNFRAPLNGMVTLNSNGTFSYTHDGGAETTDRFVYQVCVDDAGATRTCSYGLVTVAISDTGQIFQDGFED